MSLVTRSEEETPESDAAVSAKPAGAVALVSIVTDSALDSAETFPAESVWTAVIDFAPGARTAVVHVTVLVAATHGDPLAMPPTYNWTVDPTSTDKEMVGSTSEVTSSVALDPVSEIATRSRLAGGATNVSIVTTTAMDAEDVFPARSVDFAVIDRLPAANDPVVHEKDPVAGLAMQALPVADVAATNSCTVVEVSAVPLNASVSDDVTRSELDEPESLDESSVRPDGADGAAVSTVIESAVDEIETFPATSVAVAVIDLAPSATPTAVHENPPKPSAVHAEPEATPPTNNCTLAETSAPPPTVGVESFVTRSVLEAPVSLDASRAKLLGADGAVVSISTVITDEETDVFPDVFVAVAVIDRLPGLSDPVVHENAPVTA